MATATKIPAPAEVLVPVCGPPPPHEFRSRMGNISRQSGVYFAGTLLTTAAGYFLKVYLARKLGAGKLGLYALGMTLVGFAGLFNTVGIPTAAARFVAVYSARPDFARLGSFLRSTVALLVSINIFLASLIMIAGPAAVRRLYHAPELVPYLWAFAGIMFFGVLTTFLGQVMAGYHDVSRRTLITHFLGTPASIAISVLLIGAGFGLAGYLVAQLASAVLVLLLMSVAVWRMTPVAARKSGSWGVEREVIAFSAASFGIAALEFALAQADKIVLGVCLDAAHVGIYAVAMAMVGFVPIVLQSVNQIFAPAIAELYSSGSHALLQRIYSTLTRWILILTIPLALTLAMFSSPLMSVFGPAFQAGAVVLSIGAVGQLLNCAVGSVGYLLLMSGHQGRLVRIQAATAALMITLTLLLVPRLGIKGAAIATAAGVIATNAWALLEVRRRLSVFPYTSEYLKLALPTAATALTLWFVRRSGMHSDLLMAAAGLLIAYAIFFASMLASGIEPQDRTLLRAAWSRLAPTRNGGTDE
jgi:O-antigen/teichoic acid export membrane protein